MSGLNERIQIPLPRPTELSAPHWQGCREGVLRVQRCQDCDEYVFVPQPICTSCQSEALDWVKASGRATLYSYTVVHRPQQPSFDVPYIPIIALMEEGWHMLSNLKESTIDEIQIGMSLEVFFEVMSAEISLPYFRPTRLLPSSS